MCDSMAHMLKIVKALGIGLVAAVFLWVCGQLGYRYLGYCKYLTSPAACLGKMICWGAVFGTAIGTALLAGLLLVRKVRDVGYLIACIAAFILLATFRLTHLVITFCS
jgi:hypothetical protein